MPRPTAEVDFPTVVPHTEMRHLLELAGHGSALHKRLGLYLHHVGVAKLPEAYEGFLMTDRRGQPLAPAKIAA